MTLRQIQSIEMKDMGLFLQEEAFKVLKFWLCNSRKQNEEHSKGKMKQANEQSKQKNTTTR